MTTTSCSRTERRESTRRSAETIVPLIMNLVPARSVVDVGCGLGTWLAVFRENGAEVTLGIDGDWINRDDLEIPSEDFMAFDLNRPLHIDRRFDLVVSLEVAEHLLPESAETFVDSLIQLGSIILFSAAIPSQGGTHHLNERWPDYWAELFERRGYKVVDAIRRRVWKDEDVASWYAQNALLFVRDDVLEENPVLRDEWVRGRGGPISLVHPRLFMTLADPSAQTLGRIVRLLPRTFGALLAKTVLRNRTKRGA